MFQFRIKNVQKELVKQKLDALLITSVPNIAYLTGVTHFSKEEREAYILVTKSKLYIFTDKRYTDSLTDLSHLSVEEISHEFSFSKRLTKIIIEQKIKSLGFEEEQMTIKEFKNLSEKLEAFPQLGIIPTSEIIEQFRIIKDEQEIENLKKAAALTDKAFSHILPQIKLGVTEYELAAELKYFIEKNGGGIAFEPIVAFGPNSAIPHHHTSDQRLTTKDNIILFDFAASWNSYCADMTRTVFSGKAKPELKKMYETVRAAQEKAILSLSEVEPGFTNKKQPQERFNLASQVDQIARNYIVSQGYPSIPHSTGHGIGLQVHELPHVSPNDKTKLTPGMVITVEPGIYNPKIGGVRIEDDVLITKKGIEVLTKSSKELIEL